MTNRSRRVRSLFSALAAALLISGCALAADGANGVLSRRIDGGSMSSVMVTIMNGKYDEAQELIETIVADSYSDDPSRIHLMAMQARLGRKPAEKALARLQSWENDTDKSVEWLRLYCMADICVQYLDQPEKAATYYVGASLAAQNSELGKPFVISGLFKFYANNPEMHNLEKMKVYLDATNDLFIPHAYHSNRIIYLAAAGFSDAALTAAEEYYLSLDPAQKMFAAEVMGPVWGWVGEVERAVAAVELGLRSRSALFSPEGFRLYSDYVRRFRAFDTIRDDPRFIEMWERVSAIKDAPASQ